MEERNVSFSEENLTQKYEEKHRTCEVCGSDNSETLHVRSKWSGSKNLIDNTKHMFHKTDVMCMECGLVYKNPMFTEESNELFNKIDYPTIYHPGSQEGVSRHEVANSVLTAAPFLDWIKESDIDVNGKTVLDIGCGVGTIIAGLDNMGATVTGIDASDRNSEIGRKLYGVNIVPASLFDESEITGKKYDIVLIMNALEHFYSPEKVLSETYNLLSDDGTLIIEVPSIDEPYPRTSADGFLSSAHLYTFSETTIHMLLANNGFHVYDIEFKGHNKCMYVTASRGDKYILYAPEKPRGLSESLAHRKNAFREMGLLSVNANRILKMMLQDNVDMAKVDEELDKLQSTSNVVRATVGLKILENSAPEKALKILDKYDHKQSYTFKDNYGSFLTVLAMVYIQFGDKVKARKLLLEAINFFPHVFDNNFFINLCVDGIISESMFGETMYYTCCKLLRNMDSWK